MLFPSLTHFIRYYLATSGELKRFQNYWLARLPSVLSTISLFLLPPTNEVLTSIKFAISLVSLA